MRDKVHRIKTTICKLDWLRMILSTGQQNGRISLTSIVCCGSCRKQHGAGPFNLDAPLAFHSIPV